MASFDYEFNNMHAACEDQSGNDVVILEYAQVSNNVSVNQPTINCNVFEPWPNILDLPCGIEANPSINQIPLVYTIGNVSNNYLDQPNEDMMAPGNTIFLINEAITNPLTNNSNALTLLVDTPLDNCDQPVSAAAPFHGFVEQPELNSENGALFHNERTAILDRTIGAINVTQFDGTISSNFVSNITMAKTTLTPSDATGPQDSDFSESILCEVFDEIENFKQADSVGNQSAQETQSKKEAIHLCKKKMSSKDKVHGGRHECSSCDYTSDYKANLKQHVISKHPDEKPFPCKDCPKRFTSKRMLQHHMKVHANQYPFRCSNCLQGFSHETVEHEAICKARCYKCDVCKEFSTLFRTHFEYHMRKHSGEKPFGCDQCSQKFTQRNNLTRHMRIHTREKPFRCSQCSQKFAQKGDLTRHMRIHTREKPFRCNQCSQKFAQKGDLTTHMRIHAGEKPFRCVQCSQKFADKGNLTKHMRKHSGEKPFGCDQCSQKFAQKINLTRHMQTHTGEKPFRCEICSKCFARKCTLTEHKETHKATKWLSSGWK